MWLFTAQFPVSGLQYTVHNCTCMSWDHLGCDLFTARFPGLHTALGKESFPSSSGAVDKSWIVTLKEERCRSRAPMREISTRTVPCCIMKGIVITVRLARLCMCAMCAWWSSH